MKSETRNKLIAYAMHLASFLIEQGVNARKIILFGSVASGEFDKESDIDLFVDADKGERKTVLGFQGSFEKTFGERWKLKGVANPLSVTVGDINSKEWDDVRRAVQSHGITLYGHYEQSPKDIKPFVLLSLGFRGISRPQKVSIWRKLYGYEQRVGTKRYKTKGLLEQLGGSKVDKGVIIIQAAAAAEVKSFLAKNKISFRLVEVWSDQLSSK